MGIRDKSGSRSGSIHTSEHSLPEKLSQALKALRPGVLSQSSSGSSPFASKSGVVDADDVIYYTGANNKMPFHEQNSYEKKSSVKGRIFGNTRKSKSVFTKHSSPSRNDIAQFNLKSLDQIRHLYKSVPNVSSFDDGDEATPSTSRRCLDDAYAEIPSNNLSAMRSNSKYSRNSNSTKGLNADAFTATSSSMSSLGTSQSPTDSGYRSTPRHLFAAGMDSTKPPPLPTNPPPLSSPEPFTYLPRKHSTAGRDDRLYDKSPAMEKASKKEIVRKGSIYASTPVLVNSRKPSICKTSPNLSPHVIPVSRKASITSDIAPVKLPIDDRDVLNVLQKGRCKQHSHFVTLGAVPKLTTSLTVPLLRICTEASRLAKPLVKCTMNDIKYATMLCLPESVAEECIKAAIQAITLYALSGTGALRVSMSRRSGLNFSVGNFYRWMIDSHVANVVTDAASVYLCAVMECFLEKLLATLSGTLEKTESVTEENFDRLIADYLDVCRFMQAHEVKEEVNKHNRKLKQIVCAQTEADLRTILDHLYRKIHSNSILFEQNRRRSKNALYFGKQAISSLFYFTRCKGQLCACHIPSEAECEAKIYDWLRFILHFVDHRYGMHVDQQDVLQAARILLSNVDCPPYSVDLVISSPSLPGYISETKKRRHDIGMALLLTSDSEFLKEAYNLLGPQKHKVFNDYGLTALSQAVVTKNDEAVSFLIENNADINAAVPPDNNAQSSALSNEFSGWSPLSWAVAFQDIFATNKLLEAGADVDEIYMIQETPLKIATMIGDSETFARLISSGSNAFSTSKCYDSLQCTIRNLGSPSALAVAAAFGRREFVSIMLSQSRLSDSSKNDLSLTDFLSEYNNDVRLNESYTSGDSNIKSSFKKLPKAIQKASQEAVYYAVETARSDIVMQFKQLGVPWNIYTWTKCLQVGYDNHDRTTMMNVLKDFSSRLIDELTADIIDDTVAILFDVIRYETRQNDGKPVVIAKIISKLNEKFSRDNSDCVSQSNRSISVIESGSSTTSISAKPIIDPKYADNSELSDIRFKIEDKIIFAHRIVLVNASESFKRILDGPSGVIELDNITYDVFKVLINYMYGNRNICRQKMTENGLIFQLDVMEASLTFGLDQLTQECHDLISSEMSSESCSRIYNFAQRCGVQTLIEDTENYILQNFVTLIINEQILIMLQRSGQPGWCDLCAALANRLVESFETFILRNKQT